MIFELYVFFLTVIVGVLISFGAETKPKRIGYALLVVLLMGMVMMLHDDLRDIMALLETP